MTFDEIAQEIREGKNIDIHVKDSSKFVRRLVAQEGYQLEALMNDPSEEVRAAVAKRGYGLDTLRHDRSDWVRLAALEKLAERQENRNQNANYDIVHRIEAGGYHFVVGHNPKAPAAYVTWEYVEKLRDSRVLARRPLQRIRKLHILFHYIVDLGSKALVLDLFHLRKTGLYVFRQMSCGISHKGCDKLR